MRVADTITSRKSVRRCLPPTGRELQACAIAPGGEATRAAGNTPLAGRAAAADFIAFHGFEFA